MEWEGRFDFSKVQADIVAIMPAALAEAGEYVRSVAAPLTPVETGHLVGSASVTVEGAEAHIKYPGPYARYQHYMLNLRHTHGQALFLEQPMITEKSKVVGIIAKRISEVFE